MCVRQASRKRIVKIMAVMHQGNIKVPYARDALVRYFLTAFKRWSRFLPMNF